VREVEVEVTFSMDKDDKPIVTVPLCNCDKLAVLGSSDFYMLMEMGVSPLWKLLTGQVMEVGEARIYIARLICDAKEKEAVRYLDGDNLNLRRSNLVIGIGRGKSRERDKLNRDTTKQRTIVKKIPINPSYIQAIN
jgi:hypothetical protein